MTERSRTVSAVLAVVIAVQLVTGVLAAAARRGAGGAGLDPSAAAVVAELKAFVETARGLQFRQPVDVAVLDDAAFRRSFAGGEPIEQSDDQVAGGVLRALGLLEGAGEVGVTGRIDPGTVAGYYDTETKALVVRGPHLTPFVRQVLVHELTHALDDQHFDLDPVLADDEAALAFEALVEGDALYVEGRYLASMSESERREAAAEEDATFGAAGDVPRIVAELGAFPYRDGLRFVEALVAAGGTGRVDAAFGVRPDNTSEVLHPERFLDGPGRVRVPDVDAGGRVVDAGVLGELILRVVLAGALPADRAARAAAGWAGDRYVAWPAGARTCGRATVVMDSAAEAGELAAGLRQLAGATVAPVGNRPPAVTVSRCA